ncbi:glycosyltransferase [Parasphingorhabdus sp. DH2-15]|uniref:glycosyltransferase n=1 Tax=Parasphingorhabdus sp. DH2-15 TaxID=3444112 RepID=UPI003F6831AC
MTIVHISTDYPDAYQAQKTRAIANLISATRDEFDHIIYSLNRSSISALSGFTHWALNSWQKGLTHIGQDDNILSFTYSAPSYGLFLRSSLHNIADAIAENIVKKGIKPDLIQGHKLTMEGLIAERLANYFNVPYVLSVQGNTDRSILKVRRDLWPLYRRVFHNAKCVFPFAPWALAYCEKILGPRSAPSYMLPCITAQDDIISPQIAPAQIMSAFHLRHWRIKNFKQMVAAAKKAGHDNSGFNLDIYGGGSDDLRASLQANIASIKADNVYLKGALAGAQMQNTMNGYAGFAMVSKRETYGMVFAEALLAGCPIIYPENAAVDGYFNGKSFALPVSPSDSDAIARAMIEILHHQKSMKSDLAQWQESGAASQFQRASITRQYSDGLKMALASEAIDAR